MNITMYLPSWELGEPTWRVQQLATGPITEVQLGPAPHPFVVFRDLGDFDTMIGVLVGARAAHGEALSRHAARPLVPEPPGPEASHWEKVTWAAEAINAGLEAASTLEPLPDLPQREPGDALDKLSAMQPDELERRALGLDDPEPQPGGTIYAELSEDALAAHAPLLSLAADPDEEGA